MNFIFSLIVFSFKVYSGLADKDFIIDFALDTQAHITVNNLGHSIVDFIERDISRIKSEIKTTQDGTFSNLEKKYDSIKKNFLNQIVDGFSLDSEISSIQTTIDLKKSQYASLLSKKNPELENIQEEEIKLAAKKQEIQTFKDQSSLAIDKLIPKGSSSYVAASDEDKAEVDKYLLIVSEYEIIVANLDRLRSLKETKDYEVSKEANELESQYKELEVILRQKKLDLIKKFEIETFESLSIFYDQVYSEATIKAQQHHLFYNSIYQLHVQSLFQAYLKPALFPTLKSVHHSINEFFTHLNTAAYDYEYVNGTIFIYSNTRCNCQEPKMAKITGDASSMIQTTIFQGLSFLLLILFI